MDIKHSHIHRATLLAASAFVALVAGCDDPPPPQPLAAQPIYGDVNISSKIEAADGLDLQAVGDLVKRAKDAEQFEKLLNQKEGVNNLDLDANGKVDFIKVTEYGDEQTKSFSLTVEPAAGEVQEIATIDIEKAPSQARATAQPSETAQPGEAAQATAPQQVDVHVSGNTQIYGHGHHYHSSHLLSSMLLYHYMFRPHPFYVSPFHFGYHPPYFGMGYAHVNHSTYVSRTRTYVRSTPSARVNNRSSRLASPNKGRTASRGIKASLRQPTRSQKSFSARNPGPSRRSGGFGSNKANRPRSKTAPKTAPRAAPRPTRRAAPRRSPRRSFGGGRSRSRRR